MQTTHDIEDEDANDNIQERAKSQAAHNEHEKTKGCWSEKSETS